MSLRGREIKRPVRGQSTDEVTERQRTKEAFKRSEY
jgi:hypothetical protein